MSAANGGLGGAGLPAGEAGCELAIAYRDGNFPCFNGKARRRCCRWRKRARRREIENLKSQIPVPRRWPILAFFLAAIALLLLVIHRYLMPAARMAQKLDTSGRRQLAAVSTLVLVVVLILLLACILLIVRPGRFFLPRKPDPRTRTAYIDAWSEAGQRLQPPPDEDSPEEPSSDRPSN